MTASLSFAFLALVSAFIAPVEATLRGLSSSPVVTAFRLVDANANKVVLDPLVDGSVYYVDSTQSVSLTVEAAVAGSVGSVKIDRRTENVAPYTRCGDINGNFYGCSDLSSLGSHSVSATAYEGYGAKGKPSKTLSITFTVAQQPMPTAAPLPSPTEAPVLPQTNVPVSLPTDAPVSLPTDAPVSLPTDAPVSLPTDSPVASPTSMPLSTPTESPVSTPQCPKGEYYDGLQLKKCRRACTFRTGCADVINSGGPFPNYFDDSFLCADTEEGNQCAAKVDNDECGGCGGNEQCVQTLAGSYMCACKYRFGRQEDGTCGPVCYQVYPYGSCGKYASCQDTERGPLCKEVGGSPYCGDSCGSSEFCGRYTEESNAWACLPR